MAMQAVIDWIYNTSLSATIRDEFWIVPTVQAIHLCAIALVVGSALLYELRLAGLLATDETVTAVIKRHLPWMWGSLAVLLLTGLLMVWGEPERSLTSGLFWLKMGLVLVGFTLSVLFRRPLLNPKFDERDSTRTWFIKPVAWVSLCIWVAVIFSGRWIAYGGLL